MPVEITNMDFTDSKGRMTMSAGGGVFALGMDTSSKGLLVFNPGSSDVRRSGVDTDSAGLVVMDAGEPDVRRTGMKTRSVGRAVLDPAAGLLRKELPRVKSTGTLDFRVAKAMHVIGAETLTFSGVGSTTSRMKRGNGMNLTVADAAREIYALWGFEVEPYKIEFARERVLAAINAAVQTIHSQAQRLNFFNKSVVSVTTDVTGSAALPSNIQAVLTVSAGSARVREISNRGEFINAVDFYLGSDAAPDSPVFFFVDHTKVSAGDNVAMTLLVRPAAAFSLTVEAAIEPARYEEIDLIRATELQIPARFTETILWPLLRHWAASDRLFRKEELRADIERKYNLALEVLGLLAPATTAEKESAKGGAARP